VRAMAAAFVVVALHVPSHLARSVPRRLLKLLIPSRDHALHDPAGSGTNSSFVLSFWSVTFIMRSTLTTAPKFCDRLIVCLKIVPEPKRQYDYQKQDLAFSRSKNHITLPFSVNHPHYTCHPFHKTGRSCI
jgi:hypothetical protein